MTDFRPRKKFPSIYINNGQQTFWVESTISVDEGESSKDLLDAIKAARKAFEKIYFKNNNRLFIKGAAEVAKSS